MPSSTGKARKGPGNGPGKAKAKSPARTPTGRPSGHGVGAARLQDSMQDHFARLESLAQTSELNDLYLWPRTPVGHDHQDKIRERVGVTDYEVGHRKSRPARIIKAIRRLQGQGHFGASFSALDIASGDTIVLWQVQKAFAGSQCYAIDCLKGKFGTHEQVMRDGVLLYNAYLQHLFERDPPRPFDVAIMLNSYRGWDNADLREHERDLPRRADDWLARNARFVILTATRRQVRHLRRIGFRVKDLGRGEDRSRLVVASAVA